MAFRVFRIEEWIEMILYALTHSPPNPKDLLILKIYARGGNFLVFQEQMQDLIHFLFPCNLRGEGKVRVDIVFTESSIHGRSFEICIENSFCI